MSRFTTSLALGLALGLASAAQAQFSFGIGTGGGSGFYYGRGGGSYAPGYYGRGYYGPGYYGPGYGGSGVGIRVGNFGYYDYDDDYDYGRGYYARPHVNNYYVLPSNSIATPRRVLPDNKVKPTKLKLQDGDILIRSPQDAPGEVGYGINDQWIYTIKPGQKQKLEAGRQWTIEFSRGIDGAEPARYALDPGVYEFHFAEGSGWELEHVSDSVLPTPPMAREADPSAGKTEAADDVPLPSEPPREE